MPLTDRLLTASAVDQTGLVPWVWDGARIGWTVRATAERLSHYGEAFAFDGAVLSLNIDPAFGYADRTDRINRGLRELYDRDASGFGRWCDENTGVVPAFGEQPLFDIERAATGLLGVLTCGVHLNGYRQTPGGPEMWVAKRADHIAAQPGKLDQITGGFLPTGSDPVAKLQEEAADEAGIPCALLAAARPVGSTSFMLRTDWGIKRGAAMIYDLALPDSFEPSNRDGEVGSFELYSMPDLRRVLEDGDAFKFDAALVAIDFMVRHGAIPASDPDFLNLTEGLRGNLNF